MKNHTIFRASFFESQVKLFFLILFFRPTKKWNFSLVLLRLWLLHPCICSTFRLWLEKWWHFVFTWFLLYIFLEFCLSDGENVCWKVKKRKGFVGKFYANPFDGNFWSFKKGAVDEECAQNRNSKSLRSDL